VQDMNEAPLIKPGDYQALRFDPAAAPAGIQRLILDDLYRNNFLSERHFNFITPDPGFQAKNAIISVLAKSTPLDSTTQTHQCLATYAKGYSPFPINVKSDPRDTEPLLARIFQALKDLGKVTDPNQFVFNHHAFCQELATIEQKHPQKRTQMKIGVLYVGDNQIKPKEWFLNGTPKGKPCHPKFWEFMDFFGEKTDLTNFTGYLGDMGQRGHSYVDNWQGLEVMYHVSPMLTSEEHRRLVGNDIALLFFVEPDTHLNLEGLSGLGTVGQVYAAVQPVGDMWRMSFFSNSAIGEHGPPPSSTHVTLATLKDMTLTRLFNGLVMTIYSGSVSRLWYTPRSEFIQNIITNFPPLNPKELKAAQKQRQEEATQQLVIKVIAGRRLNNKGASLVEMSVTVNLRDSSAMEERKSKVSTKHRTKGVGSVAPVWNHEFSFLVSEYDLTFSDVEILCYRNTSEFCGAIVLNCKDLQQQTANGHKLQWYELQKQTPEDHLVAGDLLLLFEMPSTSEV